MARGLVTEAEARTALAMAPLRWSGWWAAVLVLFVTFFPVFVTYALTEDGRLTVVVAAGVLGVLGLPVLAVRHRSLGRLREENVVHEIVPGRVRSCTSVLDRPWHVVVDLDDGRQVRLNAYRPFAEPNLAPGTEVWVANPAPGWRSRIVFRGRGGYTTVAQPSGRTDVGLVPPWP